MRDEECFTPSSVEDDTTVRHSFDALRLGFKELYDEIDFLSEQATRTVESLCQVKESEPEMLKKTDIDDLIAYARKFVRETRKTIVTFDEHGVQCEPEKRSNKKVSTPKAWLLPQPEPEKIIVRYEVRECPFKDQSAITVTHEDIPREVANVLSDQPEQLNNKVTVATTPEVRTVGTNVNFVSQRTVAKRTNVQRVVQPPLTARSAKCPSACELRSRPVIKPRATPPATAPASTSRQQVKPPTGRTFSDGQFKLLFERFIQMQAEKHGSENVAQDAENVAKEQVEQANNPDQQDIGSMVQVE
uniref:Uncharacterized protein n=1 Tax=Anopheles maculatus TaxID=74869 RepID=A0A182S8S6_9DIPT